MIDTLITALSKELDLSAEEIADTIWLALQIQESQSESTATQKLKNDLSHPSLKSKELEGETFPETKTKTSDSRETPSKQLPEEPKAGIYPRNQQETLFKSELSFKVPDAPSLRDPLTLARALKPLMRRIPSGTTLVLDESATTQRIASEGLWLPVLRPTLEPWLDLELVVDEGISMQIWRHTIRELERLLKNYGIFRDVRVWGLIADNLEQVQIRPGIGATAKNQSPRSPAELIDPSGRRLVLVVSDCVSSLWRNGKVATALEIWAKQGSMAIVQMLPKWLWKRTALGRASEVRLQGLNPGEFNQKLIAKEVSLWDELEETRGVKVPVFTLEPDKVATWAQMLSGKGSIWTSGYVFKLDPIPVNKGRELFNLDYGQLSAEQRVQAFRVTASPMARKLAGLLAAAPAISLPIVRLIQRTLLKESQQVHVAEVFLGGLLRPLSEINAETNPNYVQYEFMDGVRELLVDSVPSGYVLSVVDEVSKDVAKNLGLSLEDFTAVLRNPQQIMDSEIARSVGYFATVTAQVLRRLGGEYVKVAEELELNNSVKGKNLSTNISTSETFHHGYALLIGVGECSYPRFSLPVTVKDTQAIYTTLVDPELCSYPDNQEHIRVLNNEKATRFDILEGLQWLKQRAEEDSEATVFVYYSGHGWVDKADDRYYLLPHDVEPFKLAASALSADEFTEGIRQIESERLLVMIDAAHSGNMAIFRHSEEVGEEFLNDFGNSPNFSPFKTFISSLKQGKGRMIFTSSQGDQASWLKDDSISLYTFHFLEALRGVANQPGDTTIKISNLVSYLSETVPQTAKKLHNANQTPCFEGDGSDFIIAKLRGGNGLPNVPLLSEKQIDYNKLRKLLITQNWKEADKETAMVMLQLSSQEKRGWLDEEDMEKVPSTDLQTIDQLWLKYSDGRFGYSVQKQVWLSVGGQLEYYDDEIYKRFGKTVGWYIKTQDKWRLWDKHIFTLDAPQGHLPSQQKEILSAILDCLATGKETEADIAFLRQVLSAGNRPIATQLGKYNVNIGEGNNIHIGDHIYSEWNDEAFQALLKSIKNQPHSIPLLPKELPQKEYTRLKYLLAAGRWRQANDTTRTIVLKAVNAEKEGWLSNEQIQNFPCPVLQIIDNLWLQYSDQRFGFSVQKRIFNECERNPQVFGDRVGWSIQNTWIFASQVIYTPANAPDGHLPWGIVQVVTMNNVALDAFLVGLRTVTQTITQQDWQKQLLADFMAFGGSFSGDRVDKEEFKKDLEYELSQDQAWWEGKRLEELKIRKLFSLLAACSNLNDKPIESPIGTIQIPRRFQSLIQDKTEDFVGREYVFDAIQTFIQENKKGYFTIIGEPGQGKSAILAKYVQDTRCIAHFNIQLQGPNRADQFLESVCNQLIARYQMPYDYLPSNATQDGEFLGYLLDEVAQRKNGQPVVIAVDALDEVDSGSYRDANILYLPPHLPDGVYFIMTRRRGVEVPFTTYVPNEIISLLDYQIDSQRDVRLYIQNRVDDSDNLRQQIEERQETIIIFTEIIAHKSENNFMYLRYVLFDIEKGLYKDLSIDRFPQGLQGYYDLHCINSL